MEDKMFELITKMYNEFSEFRTDMNEFKKDMNEFRKETKNDIIRLENKIDTNSKALFDGYKQTFEKLTVVEKKVDDISTKVEKQDVEITVIKGDKK
jgi:ferritin-like metal-binding protein YciE